MNLIPIGIQIYQSTISDVFYKFLLDQYENHLESYTRLYQNENYFDGKDYDFLKPEYKGFIEAQLSRHVQEYIGRHQLKLLNQWINIQAHDGFQPVHNHTGTISYVIYLKIPDYLKNYEDKRKQCIDYVEGAIQFNYGHANSLFPPQTVIYPEERMILMFPSEITHYVYPFRDRDSLRISISGNFVKEGWNGQS
jgi:Putative 2OG-Fe(II) oxygenase